MLTYFLTSLTVQFRKRHPEQYEQHRDAAGCLFLIAFITDLIILLSCIWLAGLWVIFR